ncbi:RcnB family protein [Pseudomonas silvicola]|uniref:RcnB family protein n=1 Tax=Pseudomonas sp. RIT-To-2 TaxID=3462541 RepID=UPI00227C336E|nr:RcnB family protein [Pseudomonas silvicola]
MKITTWTAMAVIVASLSGAAGLAQAAEQAEPTVQIPGTDSGQFKEGDKIPDHYRRPNEEVKDWKRHGLSAPEEGKSHWILVNHRYVLVQLSNSVIEKIVPAKK